MVVMSQEGQETTAPPFQITGFRLPVSSMPAERVAAAYFDVTIAGVQIMRCRLVRCDYGIGLTVRGPSFDRKRNRASFGQVNFKGATYQAITKAAVAIFRSMGGELAQEREHPAEISADVIQLLDAKRAANG
jgi:hypothetical protein